VSQHGLVEVKISFSQSQVPPLVNRFEMVQYCPEDKGRDDREWTDKSSPSYIFFPAYQIPEMEKKT
jgi:hypothetical protein